MHTGVTNTWSLQKYHIQKSTSLQLLFIREQIHNPQFSVRCPYCLQKLIWSSNIRTISISFLALVSNLVLRSLQIVSILKRWREGWFIEVEKKFISECAILQRSGDCDPNMHFIDNQMIQNPVLGPINQFKCIGTVPDSGIWSLSSVFLWRKVTAYCCNWLIKDW